MVYDGQSQGFTFPYGMNPYVSEPSGWVPENIYNLPGAPIGPQPSDTGYYSPGYTAQPYNSHYMTNPVSGIGSYNLGSTSYPPGYNPDGSPQPLQGGISYNDYGGGGGVPGTLLGYINSTAGGSVPSNFYMPGYGPYNPNTMFQGGGNLTGAVDVNGNPIYPGGFSQTPIYGADAINRYLQGQPQAPRYGGYPSGGGGSSGGGGIPPQYLQAVFQANAEGLYPGSPGYSGAVAGFLGQDMAQTGGAGNSNVNTNTNVNNNIGIRLPDIPGIPPLPGQPLQDIHGPLPTNPQSPQPVNENSLPPFQGPPTPPSLLPFGMAGGGQNTSSPAAPSQMLPGMSTPGGGQSLGLSGNEGEPNQSMPPPWSRAMPGGGPLTALPPMPVPIAAMGAQAPMNIAPVNAEGQGVPRFLNSFSPNGKGDQFGGGDTIAPSNTFIASEDAPQISYDQNAFRQPDNQATLPPLSAPQTQQAQQDQPQEEQGTVEKDAPAEQQQPDAEPAAKPKQGGADFNRKAIDDMHQKTIDALDGLPEQVQSVVKQAQDATDKAITNIHNDYKPAKDQAMQEFANAKGALDADQESAASGAEPGTQVEGTEATRKRVLESKTLEQQQAYARYNQGLSGGTGKTWAQQHPRWNIAAKALQGFARGAEGTYFPGMVQNQELNDYRRAQMRAHQSEQNYKADKAVYDGIEKEVHDTLGRQDSSKGHQYTIDHERLTSAAERLNRLDREEHNDKVQALNTSHQKIDEYLSGQRVGVSARNAVDEAYTRGINQLNQEHTQQIADRRLALDEKKEKRIERNEPLQQKNIQSQIDKRAFEMQGGKDPAPKAIPQGEWNDLGLESVPMMRGGDLDSYRSMLLGKVKTGEIDQKTAEKALDHVFAAGYRIKTKASK